MSFTSGLAASSTAKLLHERKAFGGTASLMFLPYISAVRQIFICCTTLYRPIFIPHWQNNWKYLNLQVSRMGLIHKTIWITQECFDVNPFVTSLTGIPIPECLCGSYTLIPWVAHGGWTSVPKNPIWLSKKWRSKWLYFKMFVLGYILVDPLLARKLVDLCVLADRMI